MKASKEFNSTNLSFNGKRYIIDYPTECPKCGKNIVPSAIGGYNDYDTRKLFIMFYCSGCCETFIGEYKCGDNYEHDFFSGTQCIKTSLVKCYPKNYKKEIFSDEINSISNEFEKIYNQALEAESLGLDSICGMGYRKALEFLIKDYIKNSNLTNDNIDEMSLQKCINEYIDNSTLKTLTTACHWLANDQTHYLIKHEDYSVNDIKKYLHSVVSILEGEIRSKSIIEELNNTKK